jgi:hypothetical protein
MSGPETESAIQADRAWAHFTRQLAHKVPRHLHNAQTSWRRMRQLRRRR